MTKVRSHVILVLLNMIIKPSNMRKKKNKGTTEYDKSIVTCNVGITQMWEKKRESPNVIKSTVTCDVSIA